MNLRLTLVLLALVLVAAASMPGQAKFVHFTATQTAGPVFTNFGSYICPGGEPAGPFPLQPPCSAGSRVHVRGSVFYNIVGVASDSRMKGKYIVVFNANTDGWTPAGPGSGPIWGTIRVEVEGGEGVWEGTYTGTRQVDERGVFSALHVVAHGSGGNVEGLQAMWDIISDHTSPSTIAGRILEPGGK